MKWFTLITILFTIHLTAATIDIHKLTEKVATKVQTLTDKAASSLQEFTENIDLKKLQELDFLHLIPKIQYGKMLIEEKKKKLPTLLSPSQKETLKYYGERLRSIKPSDLVEAFELPMPMWKRMDNF